MWESDSSSHAPQVYLSHKLLEILPPGKQTNKQNPPKTNQTKEILLPVKPYCILPVFVTCIIVKCYTWGLNELTGIMHLEPCLAHSKCPQSRSYCNYFPSQKAGGLPGALHVLFWRAMQSRGAWRIHAKVLIQGASVIISPLCFPDVCNKELKCSKILATVFHKLIFSFFSQIKKHNICRYSA